jgi:hypothetical protein
MAKVWLITGSSRGFGAHRAILLDWWPDGHCGIGRLSHGKVGGRGVL